MKGHGSATNRPVLHNNTIHGISYYIAQADPAHGRVTLPPQDTTQSLYNMPQIVGSWYELRSQCDTGYGTVGTGVEVTHALSSLNCYLANTSVAT